MMIKVTARSVLAISLLLQLAACSSRGGLALGDSTGPLQASVGSELPEAEPQENEQAAVQPRRRARANVARVAKTDEPGQVDNAWEAMDTTLRRHQGAARSAVRSMCTGCGVSEIRPTEF